jgi:hypothetical protein
MHRVIEQTRKAPRLMVVPSTTAGSETSEPRLATETAVQDVSAMADGSCG